MTDKLRQAAEMALHTIERLMNGAPRSLHQGDQMKKILRQALAEPPNSATDVVEPEEPLCYLQEIDTLGGAYEQVAWGEGFPVYTAPQNMEAEIKRLQELADYRLKLLTKMPSEWVGLTDEELTNIRDFYIDDSGHVDLPETFARAIESKLKEKNA